MTTTIPAPGIWHGWYRPSPRFRWQRMCSAASEADCNRQLLALCRGSGDFYTAPSGSDPNHPLNGATGWRRWAGRSFPALSAGDTER